MSKNLLPYNDLGLPWEMWHEILLRLPAESLFRVRPVCKLWRTFIDDPNFARAHITFDRRQLSHTTLVIKNYSWCPRRNHIYTLDLDAVNIFSDGYQEIPGSRFDLVHCHEFSVTLPMSECNGLILVSHDTPLDILNLSTHERLRLPELADSCRHKGPHLTGIGYDHTTQDFKVVAMHPEHSCVYSLRLDMWRTNKGVCDKDDFWIQYEGVFLCGALHWLSRKRVLVLDLGTEKHRHIHLNNALQNKSGEHKYIDVLGGCLAVSGFSSDSKQFFDVWVIKDYHGSSDDHDESSWIRLLSIKTSADLPRPGLRLRPVAYMKTKKNHVVFLRDGRTGFFMCDVEESGSIKRVYFHSLPGGYLVAQNIPKNIFRLSDYCGGGSSSRIYKLCTWGPPRKIRVSLTVHTMHTS